MAKIRTIAQAAVASPAGSMISKGAGLPVFCWMTKSAAGPTSLTRSRIWSHPRGLAFEGAVEHRTEILKAAADQSVDLIAVAWKGAWSVERARTLQTILGDALRPDHGRAGGPGPRMTDHQLLAGVRSLVATTHFREAAYQSRPKGPPEKFRKSRARIIPANRSARPPPAAIVARQMASVWRSISPSAGQDRRRLRR